MAGFAVYYDASGAQTTGEPMAVTGLIATESRWLRFEREWRALLRRSGVRHLHMKDFAHFKGEFAGWKDDEGRRAEFVRAAVQVIKRGINKGVACFIEPATMAEAGKITQMHDAEKELYTMVTGATVHHVNNWIEKRHPTSRVRHVMEHGDSGQDRLIRYLTNRDTIPTILPKIDSVTGEWFTPFQAADFVAYEVRLYASRAASGKEMKPRQSLVYLHDQLPLSYGMWNREELLATIRNNPDRFPPKTDSTGASVTGS